MNKEHTISQLRAAKKAHISWVQRAKALIEGLPVEKNQIPVDSTACAFGEWFYSDAQALNAIPGMDILKEIEKYHFDLHDMYMKIFKIYFGEAERSFFAKLFTAKKKVSEAEEALAKEYFENLRTISEVLLDLINRLDRRISALNGSIFE